MNPAVKVLLKCVTRFSIFPLVRISECLYANLSSTCVRCTHLLKSLRDRWRQTRLHVCNGDSPLVFLPWPDLHHSGATSVWDTLVLNKTNKHKMSHITLVIIHQIFSRARDWWNRGTWPDNARSRPITPVWRTNFKMDRFSSIYGWGNWRGKRKKRNWWGKLLRKQCQTSTKKSTCFASCFVLFRAAAYSLREEIFEG